MQKYFSEKALDVTSSAAWLYHQKRNPDNDRENQCYNTRSFPVLQALVTVIIAKILIIYFITINFYEP